MTKKFAIIGRPIKHSLSPILHNYWFEKYNIDAKYSIIDIKDDDLTDVVNKVKNKDLYGINITLPFKNLLITQKNASNNNGKEKKIKAIDISKDLDWNKAVTNNDPKKVLPISPMKIFDGYQFKTKKAKITPTTGIYMLSIKYEANENIIK